MSDSPTGDEILPSPTPVTDAVTASIVGHIQGIFDGIDWPNSTSVHVKVNVFHGEVKVDVEVDVQTKRNGEEEPESEDI